MSKRQEPLDGSIKLKNEVLEARTRKGLINGTGTSSTLASHNSNGLVNGNGFTNGQNKIGRSSRQIHIDLIRTTRRRQRIMSISLAIILILLPLSLYYSDISQNNNDIISIDGEFEDWQDLEGYPDSVGDQPTNPNVDIIGYKLSQNIDSGTLAFYLKVNGIILNGKKGDNLDNSVYKLDSVHIFIDSDCTSSTGYTFREFGADYMVEIQGYNNWVTNSVLMKFDNSRNRFDWNGWEYIDQVDARCQDRRLETKIWLSEIVIDNVESSKVTIGFQIQDSDGNEDWADWVVGTHDNIVIITQTMCLPELTENLGEQVMALDLSITSINQPAQIQELKVNKIGSVDDSEIEETSIYLDNGNHRFDSEDFKLMTSEFQNSAAIFVFEEPLDLEKGQDRTCYITAKLSDKIVPHRTLGFEVSAENNIIFDNNEILLNIESTNIGLGYLGELPSEIIIDGAFGDWQDIPSRKDVDDYELINKNIDVNEYRIVNGRDDISFYFEVKGTMMGGTSIPMRPDYIVTTPKQSTPAIDILSQKADPQIVTSIKQNIPIPEVIGEDAGYIFIDTDMNEDTGLNVDGLEIGADYLVQITGKNGNILSNRCYKYRLGENGKVSNTESIKNWVYITDIPVASDESRLETQLDFKKLSFEVGNLEYLKIYFYFEDWHDAKDGLDEPVEMSGLDNSEKNYLVNKIGFGTRGSAGPLNILVSGVGNRSNDRFGWNVSYCGNINNDGYDDIIIGSPYNDSLDGSKVDAGAAYVFYGYPTLELNNINASNANVTLTGANAGDYFGWAVSSAGDADGNSYDDIIIGAPGTNEAYIFLSADDGSGIANGASPNITLIGNSGDKFGYSVGTAANFDAATTGFDDVVVGAPYNDTVYSASNIIQDTGAVFFFYNNGSMSTTIYATSANLTHRGENSSNFFGAAIAGAGDVNGDSYDDVIVGSPGYSNSQGRAYIYYGNSTYIDDDFEAYSGDNPGGNWATSENEVNYIVDMTSAVSHGMSGTKSVSITDSNVLNVARLRDETTLTEATHHKLSVECAVRVSTTIGTDKFIITLKNESGDSGPTIIFESNGWIRYKDNIGPKDIMPYIDNIWYNIRMIADVHTSKFDCYIWSDSNTAPTTPQVEGGGFENVLDKMERLVFSSGSSDRTLTDGWVDDVKIYNMTMLTGESQGDNFGWAGAGAGDVNGDMLDDVIIGAPKYDSKPGTIDNNGRSYIFFGNASNFGELCSFFDGFEVDLSKWDDNGLTSWELNTSQKHSGLRSVSSTQGSEGYLTSDDIDLSGASAAILEFWIRKDAVEAGDIMLQYYDGSTYNDILDLDDLGADNQWLKCRKTINVSEYGIANFRIRFNATLGINEIVWIDDWIIKVWYFPGTDSFSDNFEVDLTNWDENGATLWYLSTDQKQEGLQSVKSEQNNDGSITSDDIDLTRASYAVLELWYRKNLTDLNDFLLEFFNGASYVVIQDFEDIGVDGAWLKYNCVIDLDLFKLQNFRIRFNTTLGVNEFAWIDNLTLKIFTSYNVVLTGETSGDRFGWAVSTAGDINNDGYDDMIIGAPYNDSMIGNKLDAGAIYVVYGNASMTSKSAGEADNVSYGEVDGDHLGWAVSQAGNIDGTGSDNVIVSAPHFDDGAKLEVGKVYILTIGTVIPEFTNVMIPIIMILICIAIFKTRPKKLRKKIKVGDLIEN